MLWRLWLLVVPDGRTDRQWVLLSCCGQLKMAIFLPHFWCWNIEIWKLTTNWGGQVKVVMVEHTWWAFGGWIWCLCDVVGGWCWWCDAPNVMWWEGWAGAVEWPLVTNSHASEALSGWSFLCGTWVVQLWYSCGTYPSVSYYVVSLWLVLVHWCRLVRLVLVQWSSLPPSPTRLTCLSISCRWHWWSIYTMLVTLWFLGNINSDLVHWFWFWCKSSAGAMK